MKHQAKFHLLRPQYPPVVPRALSSPSADVNPALRVTSPATYLTPTFVTELSKIAISVVELF